MTGSPSAQSFAGRRTAAAQRLSGPPQLSAEAARLDKIDRDEFERQAALYLKPDGRRPALLVADEVETMRTEYKTGQGALKVLVQVANKRLDYFNETHGGGEPFDPISDRDRAKCAAFFEKYGARLVDQPRKAPDNPLTTPKPGADKLIEQSKVDPAKLDRLTAPAVSTETPVPTQAPAAPKPAGQPDQSLVLLTRMARANEEMAKQMAALVLEIQGLRAELAALPVATGGAAPAAGSEAQIAFVMDVLAVGFDDKSGEKTYKARGPQFKTFGVRVWPEVLDELGLDEDKLKMGENKLPKPIKVRAVLTADGKPRKVTGRAP